MVTIKIYVMNFKIMNQKLEETSENSVLPINRLILFVYQRCSIRILRNLSNVYCLNKIGSFYQTAKNFAS